MKPALWYDPLERLESKGSNTDPVGGLAGLAAARAEHEGQFFTPLSLVSFMWHVTGLLARKRNDTVSILDNAFGSGRMFAFADPKRHRLAGIEIDVALAERVQAATEDAGFDRCVCAGSFDEFRGPKEAFTVGLINPPFSLTIDTPYVEAFETSAYGRHGPHSSALSHVFCVEQALSWCRHVAAVVPRSMGDNLLGTDPKWDELRVRLVAVYTIPRTAFRDEGANVETVVCVWGHGPRSEYVPVRVETIRDLDNVGHIAPLFDLDNHRDWGASINLEHVRGDASTPVIRIPHTGDRTVRVVHDGRKLGLRFACGYTQGRVLNDLYRQPARSYLGKGLRQAKGVEWSGQGWFDLENHLAQDDPEGALDQFTRTVELAGGSVSLDPSIRPLLSRLTRRSRIHAEPFRHVAYVDDGGLSHWLDHQSAVVGKCCEPLTLSHGGYHASAVVVDVGESVTLVRAGRFKRGDHRNRRGPKWDLVYRNWATEITQDQLTTHFEFRFGETSDTEGWQVVHEGLAAAFPAEYESTRKRAVRLGLDKWCSWTYQFDDLCELGVKRRGIVGWDMGLGKARLALALCMLGEGRHNLITVEAHLLDEMRREIDKLGIQGSDWQVITKLEHVDNLRRINLISYSRLKSEIKPLPPTKVEIKQAKTWLIKRGEKVAKRADESSILRRARHRGWTGWACAKKTFADALRRRIHTHVCDEGHILRNDKTKQTRAVLKVSAKVRYLMSGTPIANYPRDILPLIQWAGGDGTSAQVFGRHHPFMRLENLLDLPGAARGVDVFREMFVTTTWVTNLFTDNLRDGAKREIPEIADVTGFRAMAAPWIKRRVMYEPDVARHITIPRPEYVTTTLKWDRLHLAFYVKVAREFVEWYKKLYDSQRKGVALIAILAKMQAVQRAATFPAFGVSGQAPFKHETSKQRHVIKRLRQWTAEGHKSIALCESPDVVRWMSAELAKHGVESVQFHGGVTIAKRIKALDRDFREGDVPVLLATKGCLQTGYNIHQASRVIAVDRTWTPKTEQQAFARVLRPQQTRQVVIELVHLPGSIDDYQAQMVTAKASAASAGLDFGSEATIASEFHHIETILGRFVEEFEERHGITADELIAEVG